MNFGYVKIWTKIRNIFLYAESHVKGVKISLEKKIGFFISECFSEYRRDIMRDRKKMF